MTAVAILLAGVGLMMLWGGITGKPILAELKAALGAGS